MKSGETIAELVIGDAAENDARREFGAGLRRKAR
jgi:hypothetical protein